MASAAPHLRGPEFAASLFQQIEVMARESIARTGDIDPEPIARALDLALKIPECREAVILFTARYIASCMTGAVPDTTTL